MKLKMHKVVLVSCAPRLVIIRGCNILRGREQGNSAKDLGLNLRTKSRNRFALVLARLRGSAMQSKKYYAVEEID